MTWACEQKTITTITAASSMYTSTAILCTILENGVVNLGLQRKYFITFFFCLMYYKITYEIHSIMNMYLSFSGNRLATNVSEVIYKNEKKYKCVWCIFSSLQKVIMINCNLYWRFSVICTYFWNTVDVNCNSSLCSQLAPFRLS